MQISAATGMPFAAETAAAVGGGCINEACRIEGGGRRFFIKLNRAGSLAMFEAEAAGLREILDSRTLRVPTPVCWGENPYGSWLVLEYLEMARAAGDAVALGRGLAAMHRTVAKEFGWVRDNTIGGTPQPNRSTSAWTVFWREQRLAHQLQLAWRNGHEASLRARGEQLLERLDAFFAGAEPAASLLHGDLWSGNHGYDVAGQPLLFDPAVYYGDRETDLAMTELFGGFPATFYAAYREAYPLDRGYAVRKILYNLYHVLNHLNLFGGGYLQQARRMMEQLLAETRG